MSKKILLVFLAGSAMLISGCNAESKTISGSGTIEADQYQIAAEISGKVAEVNFDEGDSVKSGELLFSLDSDMLEAEIDENLAAQTAAQANLASAQANLELAKTQYDATLKSSRSSDEDDREDQWQEDQPAEFDLPVWFYSKEERLEAAQNDIEESYQTYQTELAQLQKILDEDKNTELVNLEEELANARMAYENARTTLNHARNAHDNDDLLDAAQDQYDTADSALDNAQSEYDALLSSEEYDDVLRARAEATAARERYEVARDALAELQSADQSPEVLNAGAAVALSETQVQEAEANLEQSKAAEKTLQIQLEKTQILSPTDGVILYRNIEAGETIAAAENVMTVANLEKVNLVVYIPEEYYGQIQTGQAVLIQTDSYPNETFKGNVVYIADEAEFTPRNVQTVDGRKSTVYAIKISIVNSDLKLKDGMPADAVFQ